MTDDAVDRARLGTAVRSWIDRGNVIGEAPAAIVVVHEATNQMIHTVRAGEIPAPPTPEKDTLQAIDDLVELIASKMEGDAAGHGGTAEQYYVELRYAANLRKAEAREPFLLSINRSERRGRTEKPTTEGINAFALRHMESSYGRTFAYMERAAERADARAATAWVENAALRRELTELRVAFDDLLNTHEVRSADARAREERSKMVRELFLDVKTYLPVIVNRMSDEKLMPEGELAPEQKLLRELVRQMQGPEVAALVGVMAEKYPRIGVMLSELVLKVQDEDLRRFGIKEAAERTLASSKAALGEAPPAEPQAEEPKRVSGKAPIKQLRAGAPLGR